MQLLMLWSHKFTEARYDSGVTYTGLNQVYFFFGLLATIQVGFGDRKTFFYLPNLYPYEASFLFSLSKNDFSC